ncbi:MAG: chitinase [Frankiales bacterium]|nr:chitinase [Frankiales bacterium]
MSFKIQAKTGAVALACAAVACVTAVLPTPSAHAAVLESANFNAGNLSEWQYSSVPNPNPYGATIGVDASRTYEGAYAAKAHTGPGPGIQYARTLWGDTSGTPGSLNWGAGKDVHYGMALYLPQGFNASMQSYFVPMRWDTYGVSNVSRGGLAMYGDGSWRLFRERDGVESQTNLLPSTFRLSEGTWHWLEVHQKLSATDGQAVNELWVDGSKIGSSTARNFYGTPVSAIRYGVVATDQDRQTNPLTVWYDRAVVSDSYIGPVGSSAPPSSPPPSSPPPTSPPTSADTQAPSAPASATVTSRTSTSVGLSWAGSSDNVGVTAYDVWRGDANYANWVLAGTVGGTTSSFTVGSLNPGTGYTFSVRARDAAGNTSASSNIPTATTTASSADTQAPSAPSSLTATGKTKSSVSLAWNAATDNVGVSRYEIWRGDANYGNWILAGSVASGTRTFTSGSLASRTGYTFAIRAFDAAGNKSASSNIVAVSTS